MNEVTPKAQQALGSRLNMLYRASKTLATGQTIGPEVEKTIRAIALELQDTLCELWGYEKHFLPKSIEDIVKVLIKAYEILIEDLPIQ